MGSMCCCRRWSIGFLLSGRPPGCAVVAVAGAVTIATFAVTIVMGQEYLPGRLGVAAGVTIGLSIGLGGIGAPLLGLLADAHGLRAVFEVIAGLPLLALLLTWRCRRGPRTPADAWPTPRPAARLAGSRSRKAPHRDVTSSHQRCTFLNAAFGRRTPHQRRRCRPSSGAHA